MLRFKEIDRDKFLTEFWQKKPLVFRQAIVDFTNLISPDELAGLSLEDEVESRLVLSTPNEAPFWHLKEGPFLAKDFKSLSDTHWTLLVQGVDRIIPELSWLFDHFSFIPQWRIDDLMISYATEHGSVGPHYDQYDVFLYQAQGSRKWSLTSKNCNEDNYTPDIPLRIMQQFDVEEEYILNEGDMLYLPPGLGHYGTALDGSCMTYSFGYRSYVNQEIWDSFGDYCSENKQLNHLYKDPKWTNLSAPAMLTKEAWQQAKQLMELMLQDEEKLAAWFGCFATTLDRQAEALIPEPRTDSLAVFMKELRQSTGLIRQPFCRFAYQKQTNPNRLLLYINGCEWDAKNASNDLVAFVANQRQLPLETLQKWLKNDENQNFLFELWTLQWLIINDQE